MNTGTKSSSLYLPITIMFYTLKKLNTCLLLRFHENSLKLYSLGLGFVLLHFAIIFSNILHVSLISFMDSLDLLNNSLVIWSSDEYFV